MKKKVILVGYGNAGACQNGYFSNYVNLFNYIANDLLQNLGINFKNVSASYKIIETDNQIIRLILNEFPNEWYNDEYIFTCDKICNPPVVIEEKLPVNKKLLAYDLIPYILKNEKIMKVKQTLHDKIGGGGILYEYCESDIIASLNCLEAMRQEEYIPLEINKVIFNDPATIIQWNDGTKTVVKCSEGEKYDPEKGLAMAMSKRLLGNTGRYYETFKYWLQKMEKQNKKKK